MDTFLAVLAMGFDVVFITCRRHVDVALGLGGEVAGGFGCAGDDVDVATGIELQVTIALYARRELKGGLSPFIVRFSTPFFVSNAFLIFQQTFELDCVHLERKQNKH